MKKTDIVQATTNDGKRLYVIVSPNEMNLTLNTVVACPLVCTKSCIPTRVLIKASAKSGLQSDCFLALDQIMTLDKSSILGKTGEISESETERVTVIMQEMFAL